MAMGVIAHRQDFTGAASWPGDLSTLEEVARFVQLYLGCELALVSVAGSGGTVASRGDTVGTDEFDAASLSDPMLAHKRGMRFYAGLPVRDADGQHLGTMAAMDSAERALSGDELTMLRMVAQVAADLCSTAANGASPG